MPSKKPAEKTPKTPKLSSLILLGCKLDGKGIRGKLFQWDDGVGYSAPPTHACALGAAIVGKYAKEYKRELVVFRQDEKERKKAEKRLGTDAFRRKADFQFLENAAWDFYDNPGIIMLSQKDCRDIGYPWEPVLKDSLEEEEDFTAADVTSLIPHLNDIKKWKREKIAKWLKDRGY